MLVFRFAIVCYVLICFSSRSSSINIINQTHNQYQTKAWEAGFLSMRHGYCNRWRQSHSRWTLQGNLKIPPNSIHTHTYSHIHIPVHTYIHPIVTLTYLKFSSIYSICTDLFMLLILLLCALISFLFLLKFSSISVPLSLHLLFIYLYIIWACFQYYLPLDICKK